MPKDKKAKPLPNRLREWRKACGLTLEEAADRLGTTNQTLSRYETGSRSVTLDMLAQIAPIYGCRPADLLADPESVLSDRERRVLDAFRGLSSPEDGDYILRVMRALGRAPEVEQAAKLQRRIG